MGLSSYSTPADVGVFCVILVNTAISISIFKEIFRSILQVMGIHIASQEDFSLESSDSVECRRTPSELYVEEFQSRTPAVRYDSMIIRDCPKEECPVCLSEFKQNAEVNCLSCGHVFHKSCLEKWLKYWNVTCPLCRNHMMPQETEDDACPMLYENHLPSIIDILQHSTSLWLGGEIKIIWECQLLNSQE